MLSSYIDSYYSRTLNDGADYPALSSDVEAEVCIIGGGLAGLATAAGLAERGVSDVAVLEASRIGFGASGRNGGFCLAGYAAGMCAVSKKVGHDRACEMMALTLDAQKLIRKRITDHNIDCNPVDGSMVASWYDNDDAVRCAAEEKCSFGEPVEFWDKDRVRDSLKSERYHSGLFFPGNFHMHPLNYLRGLAAAVTGKGGTTKDAKGGVRIFEQSPVVSVDTKAAVKMVKTRNGTIRAKHVVYCGSAYAHGVQKRLERSCLPIATYVMVTEPLTPAQRADSVNCPYAVRDNRWSDDYYRILPDGRLLWGGRVALNREPSPEQLKTVMMGDLLKVYPQLAGIRAEVAWSGLMGYSVHKMPLIGKFADGVWYCTNFGGNGVGPTTAGGEVIASAIVENDRRYEWFKPFGFQYTGGILGPLVGQAIYHSWGIGDKLRELAA